MSKGVYSHRALSLKKRDACMTDSTENATPPKSARSRTSNSSVRIQIRPKSQLEFVLRDTEESEYLDLVDFKGIAFTVESAIHHYKEIPTIYNLCDKSPRWLFKISFFVSKKC